MTVIEASLTCKILPFAINIQNKPQIYKKEKITVVYPITFPLIFSCAFLFSLSPNRNDLKLPKRSKLPNSLCLSNQKIYW
jgi:hypothetical protein